MVMRWWRRLVPYAVREALDVRYQLRRVRWFFQRGRRGFADCDLWSYGTYSAARDARALRAFMANPGGVPASLCGDYGDRPFADGMVEWQRILTEIVEGLESGAHAGWDCDCENADRDALKAHDDLHHRRFRRAHELLGEWQLGIWH